MFKSSFDEDEMVNDFHKEKQMLAKLWLMLGNISGQKCLGGKADHDRWRSAQRLTQTHTPFSNRVIDHEIPIATKWITIFFFHYLYTRKRNRWRKHSTVSHETLLPEAKGQRELRNLPRVTTHADDRASEVRRTSFTMVLISVSTPPTTALTGYW